MIENIYNLIFCELFSLSAIENVETLVNFRINIEQRNGKAYAIPSNISVVRIDVQYAKLELNYQYLPSIVENIVDKVFISNWKMVKSMMDPTLNVFVGDTMESVLIPLLNQMSLHEVINMESINGGQC